MTLPINVGWIRYIRPLIFPALHTCGILDDLTVSNGDCIGCAISSKTTRIGGIASFMLKSAPCKQAVIHDNEKGILAGPLIFSAFVGLLLVVVLYPILMKLDFSSRLRHGLEGSIFIFVLFIVVLAYQSAKAIKIRKFLKGAEAPLLVRDLMTSCLQGDIECLQKLFAEREPADFRVMLTLLQAKAESILQTEIAHMTDIHKKIGLRIFNKKCNLSYHLFFRNPDEYSRASLPREIVLLRNALKEDWPTSLSRDLDEIENSRRALFTLFNDYLDIVPEQVTHLRFLRQTYKYRSPAPDIARKITFCLDVFDCVDRLKENGDRSPLMNKIEATAETRIPLLRKAMGRYQSAWEAMVDTYEFSLSY